MREVSGWVIVYYVASILVMLTLLSIVYQQSADIKCLREIISHKDEVIDEYSSVNRKLLDNIKAMRGY